MTDTEAPGKTEAVQYETKTVKVVRGTEAWTISKRESDGWELVSQSPGKLRTELVFRRPKPKPPWRLIAILGGALVLLFIFIGIMATLEGRADGSDAAPSETPHSEAVAPSEEPSAEANAPAATVPSEEPAPAEPAPDLSAAVAITVDELLGKLNSAAMGGIENGDQFKLTGELSRPDLWMTGATGDYSVLLKAQGGAQSLMVFVDEADAAGWGDGTTVDMVLEAVDATIDGETTGGWLRVIWVSPPHG